MSKVLTIEVDKYGSINPNKLKGWFFPNWFEKEHIEEFLGKKISNKDFEEFKSYACDELGIHNEVSELVDSFINETWEGFKEYQKENE